MKKVILLIVLLSLMSFKLNDITSKASWYGETHHGRTTASGEKYNMYDYTAAHKTLKFGTKLLVTNIKNGKTVTVRVNDRGPYVKSRDLDLSKVAFKQIANLKAGTINVKYKILK